MCVCACEYVNEGVCVFVCTCLEVSSLKAGECTRGYMCTRVWLHVRLFVCRTVYAGVCTVECS